MASWTTWLHAIAFALAAYWLHAGYRALILRGKQATFRLEQRRKAGIPDSDTRPFNIAQADAAQKRRQQQLANKAVQKPQSGSSKSLSAPQKILSRNGAQQTARSPFRPTEHAPGSPLSRVYPSPSIGARTSNAQKSNLRSVGDRPAVLLPSPGESSRYDPGTYSPSAPTSSNLPARSLYEDVSKSPSNGAPDHLLRPEAEFENTYGSQSYSLAGPNQEADSTMAWDTSGLHQASRGKKRSAEETRSNADHDSVAGRNRTGKRGKPSGRSELDSSEQLSTMSEDEEDLSDEDNDTDMPSRPLGDTDSEATDETDQDTKIGKIEIARRRLATLPHSRQRQTQTLRKERKNRSMRDEIVDLDDDVDLDQDESMLSVASGQGSKASKKNSRLDLRADLSDSEREIGEEWTGATDGLQWRMDLDDVDTEEETPTGRKRRVTVKRRTRRRLTVKKELRPKWAMPADSLHPDKDENVVHYVPVWLSDQEFAQARYNGELGSQVGVSEPERSPSSVDKTTASPGRSPRSLDLLFHQAPHRLPLRSQLSSSKLSSPSRQSPSASSRSTTPDLMPSIKSGRVSLASAINMSARSPLRAYALDSAAKRRREEELMHRLRQDQQNKVKDQTDAEQQVAKLSGFLAAAKEKPVTPSGLEASVPGTKADSKGGSSGGAAASAASEASAPSAGSSTSSIPPFGSNQQQQQQQSTQQQQSFSFSGTPASAPNVTPSSQTAASTKSASTAAMPGGFTFGQSSTAPVGSDQPKKGPPSFTFGAGNSSNSPAPAASQEKTTSSSFTFGTQQATTSPAPTQTPTKSSAPSFTFANNPTSQSATPSAGQSKPTFTFGGAGAGDQPQNKASTLSGGGFTFGSKN